MKRIINKVAGPVCALGAGIGVASCLWLAIYTAIDSGEAWKLIILLLGACLLMLAGWVGVRFFPKQHIWPGACMVVSAPVCVWCGVAGPGKLLGVSYGIILDALDGYSLDALEYITIPGMVAAILCAVAFALVGLGWLVVDIYGMVTGEADWVPDTKAQRADRYYGGGPRTHAPAELHQPMRTASPAPQGRRRVTSRPTTASPVQSTPGGSEYSLEPFENIGYEPEATSAPENMPAQAGSTRVMSSNRPRPATAPPPEAAGQPGRSATTYTRERTPYTAQNKKSSGGVLGGLGGKLFGKSQPRQRPYTATPATPVAPAAPHQGIAPPQSQPVALQPTVHKPLEPNPYVNSPPPSDTPENP